MSLERRAPTAHGIYITHELPEYPALCIAS